MENYRLIPFDLSRAKTPENPSGLEVVTKGDNDKEHRVVHSVFDYIPGRSNEPVDSILIRSNGGEWREPYITEEGKR